MKINLNKRLSYERARNGGGLFTLRGGPTGTVGPKALHALAREILDGTYLPMDCPSCGRRRLEWDEQFHIVCEKCGRDHSEVSVSHVSKDAWPGKQCNVKPDLDNVAKLVSDALNGIAYKDDAQMRRLTVEKAYGQRSGVEVRLILKDAKPKPRNGLLPHPAGLKTCWQLWHNDVQLGQVLKVRGGYQAHAGGEELGEYHTRTAAVEAIRGQGDLREC